MVIVVLARAAREPAYNNGCALFLGRLDTPALKDKMNAEREGCVRGA